MRDETWARNRNISDEQRSRHDYDTWFIPVRLDGLKTRLRILESCYFVQNLPITSPPLDVPRSHLARIAIPDTVISDTT